MPEEGDESNGRRRIGSIPAAWFGADLMHIMTIIELPKSVRAYLPIDIAAIQSLID